MRFNWLELVRPSCIRNGWHLAGLIIGHGAIAAVYLRIPFVLRRIVRRLGGAVFGGGIVRKAANFVEACAFTHIAVILALFVPAFDGGVLVVLAATVVISLRFERLASSAEDLIVETIEDARALGVKVEALR